MEQKKVEPEKDVPKIASDFIKEWRNGNYHDIGVGDTNTFRESDAVAFANDFNQELLKELADLRAERDKVKDECKDWKFAHSILLAENERLKAENERLKEYLMKRLEYCKKNNLHYYHNVEIHDIQTLLKSYLENK